jgi:hypothetical protein
MDNVFLLTLLFIFLTALISTYIARRGHDRCLRDLASFNVTIELKDGRIVWGQLVVFSNGLEMLYKLPRRDSQGHLESSAILFADQITNIQAIYRYHDELNEANKKERQLEILRTYHPGLHRQLARLLRSFLNTFRDALNESIGFVISSVKEKGTSTVVQTQDKRLAKIGQTVLGATANAYEPILERYIGRRVVAEEIRGETTIEHPGSLKEYTAQWLELLDCPLVQEHIFDLAQPERLQLNRDLDFIIRKQEGAKPSFTLTVENHGTETFQIKRFEAQDYTQAVDTSLLPKETISIDLTDLPETIFEGVRLERIPTEIFLRAEHRSGLTSELPEEVPALPSLRLVIKAVREGDICLPRQHAFVRHGVEAPGQGWLKEAWEDFSPWIRSHPWRAFGRCSWILFNIILGGTAGWAVATGLAFGGRIFNLFIGLGLGLLYGGVWLVQWSMVIQGEVDYARRLRRRLSLTTIILIVILVLFGLALLRSGG